MGFALSRTMRASDYQQFEKEQKALNWIKRQVGGEHPAQHAHRTWEYCLLLKTIYEIYGPPDYLKECFGIDFACGVGLGGSILLANGCSRVKLTEIWHDGDWSDWQLRQMRAAAASYGGAWDLASQDMVAQPEPPDHKYQASLCVSSLEHIPDWKAAVENLAACTDVGGMCFFTMDYAGNGDVDNYALAHMRARMYDARKMQELREHMERLGFVVTEEPDWTDEIEELANNYTFASLVMVKAR